MTGVFGAEDGWGCRATGPAIESTQVICGIKAGHLQPHSGDTSTRADYVAMVERVDQGVGDILDALDCLGLAENTLVIFTNDNGGEWLARNDPLFHRKWTVWEGGIRVPALARWPARIPVGRVSDQVGITMDLTVTLLAAVAPQGSWTVV